MAVKIGHASIDENGKARNGRAGDQTGKELCIRNWYSKPWTSVIRPKSSEAAERIATAMEQACANNNIGYDQNERTTLFTQAKAHNWDLSKIISKCETDCSALVSVCVNAAGISISKDIYTGNQLEALKKTKKFDIFTSIGYTLSGSKLKRGDILLGKGHTAIVLSDGKTSVKQTTSSSSAKVASAKKFNKDLAGTYKTVSALHLRTDAGKMNQSIVVMPKGTKVKNYGYYSGATDNKWLLVKTTVGGISYTGFASIKYLIK